MGWTTWRGAHAGNGWPTRWIAPPSSVGTGRFEGRARPCDAAVDEDDDDAVAFEEGGEATVADAMLVAKERRGLRRCLGVTSVGREGPPAAAAAAKTLYASPLKRGRPGEVQTEDRKSRVFSEKAEDVAAAQAIRRRWSLPCFLVLRVLRNDGEDGSGSSSFVSFPVRVEMAWLVLSAACLEWRLDARLLSGRGRVGRCCLDPIPQPHHHHDYPSTSLLAPLSPPHNTLALPSTKTAHCSCTSIPPRKLNLVQSPLPHHPSPLSIASSHPPPHTTPSLIATTQRQQTDTTTR